MTGRHASLRARRRRDGPHSTTADLHSTIAFVRFLIEFDGVLVDVFPVLHLVHERVATEVGWSRLDLATFRRLTRTKGSGGDVLPGAPQAKVRKYHTRFSELAETEELIGRYQPHAETARHLHALRQFGLCTMVTLGSNVGARRAVLERAGLLSVFSQAEALTPDPRRRPGELKALAAQDNRTIVAASTDALLRAASAAEVFTVGISNGTCTQRRLFQAGADVVYSDPGALSASVQSGARDLIRAGLLPPPLG